MAFPTFNRRQFAASMALPAMMAPWAKAWAGTGTQHDALFQAYCVAFPLFEFARTGWAAAGPSASRAQHRYNQMVVQPMLSDERSRTVTTPNRDTLYATARLDLSHGPALVQIPSVTDRYFSVALMNAFTDNFAYFGTRATGGQGVRALVAGPDWRGETPSGAVLIRSETRDVWLLARAHVPDPADQTGALAVLRQIVIAEASEPALLPVAPTRSDDLANILAVANAMLARCSPESLAARGVRDFGGLGLEPGSLDAWQRLASHAQEAWRSTATKAQARFRQGFARGGPGAQGWRYPAPAIGSTAASWELRAGVALSGLGAVEQIEATYARTDVDSKGDPLIGERQYRLEIPADVPAAAFWSVTLYVIEADGRLFFHANPQQAYSISNRMPQTRKGSDGRTSILIGPSAPQDPATNWLPSAQGRLALVFRAYLPQPALRRGEWLLPGVPPV